MRAVLGFSAIPRHQSSAFFAGSKVSGIAEDPSAGVLSTSAWATLRNMCGRYKLSAKHESVWEHFDIHGEIPFEFVPRYNIAPTQPIAIVREPHRLEQVRWGLKLPNPRAGGFNVRVESLGAPFYRDSIDGRRCLIIADAFYEWKVIGDPAAKKPLKQPYMIKRHDGEPFAFAGIWDRAKMPNGAFMDCAAILTTTPRGVAAQVHDRMPVILPADAHNAWINRAVRWRDLLEPDADTLELVAVSSLVNSVKNEDAQCAVAIPGPNSA
jgi:putative SOS response-associated peptidase YedK